MGKKLGVNRDLASNNSGKRPMCKDMYLFCKEMRQGDELGPRIAAAVY